ncbi:1983_t:CDS:2 [Funneliformis mosseae]|uniref:1983_t:CDS:1 n=1 Tax=Funneliformis mosseae TaxID=27381 RepID=A0A9N9D406_FUNMO|nr:1983_t:CDS:2 [Funneliformis mosseae]
MREKYNSKILVSGERFSYVVTHPENTFDLHSRKLMPTKGEKMKFADVKYELAFSSRIMQIEDSDEKYKQIDDYAQVIA